MISCARTPASKKAGSLWVEAEVYGGTLHVDPLRDVPLRWKSPTPVGELADTMIARSTYQNWGVGKDDTLVFFDKTRKKRARYHFVAREEPRNGKEVSAALREWLFTSFPEIVQTTMPASPRHVTKAWFEHLLLTHGRSGDVESDPAKARAAYDAVRGLGRAWYRFDEVAIDWEGNNYRNGDRRVINARFLADGKSYSIPIVIGRRWYDPKLPLELEALASSLEPWEWPTPGP